MIGFDNTALMDFNWIQLDSVECNTFITAEHVIEYIKNPKSGFFGETKYEIIHRGSL